MKVIFATTNNRKLEDLNSVIKDKNLDLQVISLADINWDRGEIEETGLTIEENSLIKARAVLDFCKAHNIEYPIITDDAGLFVESLGGKPGVYTARYADYEISLNPDLPKYYALYKLLNNMKNIQNRNAEYRCCVTIIQSDGSYLQFTEKTSGYISNQINEPIKKPYFYSLFVDDKTNIPFNQLSHEQLKDTYRFKALKAGLTQLNSELNKNEKALL